jgi:hypothetical protein
MLAVAKSIRLEGFIVSNHFNLWPDFKDDMSGRVSLDRAVALVLKDGETASARRSAAGQFDRGGKPRI